MGDSDVEDDDSIIMAKIVKVSPASKSMNIIKELGETEIFEWETSKKGSLSSANDTILLFVAKTKYFPALAFNIK